MVPTFQKNERLKARGEIETLFKSGKSLYSYPFRILYQLKDGKPQVLIKTLFTVPKRNFKKAVQRNKIRRRMKETYRLNKYLLPENNDILTIGFIYTGKKALPFSELENNMVKALKKLGQII